MFQKYVKRQIPVDAVLVNEDNIEFILRELEEDSIPFQYNPENKTLKIKTLEGWHEGKVGQHYLVRGVESEYYFVRRYIFEKTYTKQGREWSIDGRSGDGISQPTDQTTNLDKKLLFRKVNDIGDVKVADGKFLAYNYIGNCSDEPKAVLVEQDKEQSDKVYIEIAKIIPNESWVTEYYIVLDREDGAVVNQTEKADFTAFDYEYIPWDNDLHLELRFWFDYQEVVVLEVNLGPQTTSI